MSKTVSLEAHKLRKAAQRGFREWRRLFPGPPDLDENTRIQDLPDPLLLHLCEDIPQSRVLIYDLLMGAYGLGSGYDFESQAPEQIGALLDPFFLITDQIRFDCLRRLDWAYPSPASVLPLIELVLQIRHRISLDFLGTPELKPAHPAYSLLKKPGLLEQAVFLRRLLPEAVKEFRERIQKKES
ncbi:MAG: hypothetical protein HY892_12945 [Deltaproteobacteria bacterium]|nr:hypothetical protein [Deltaproteobacteria bacterium]